MPDPTACQVVEQAELVAATALTLVQRVRKLRRLQGRCTMCRHSGKCADLLAWRTAIDSAVRELIDEWANT